MNELPPIEPETAALPLSDAVKITALRRRVRRLQRLCKATVAFSIVSSVVVMVATFALLYLHPGDTPWVNYLYFPLMLFSAFPTFLAKKWRKTIHALTKAVGLQEVGPLVESLEIVDESDVTMALLVNVLPRLQSSDAHLLTPQHHRLLNRRLSGKYHLYHGSRLAFILATLKSYEQIGGMEDLPTVTRLAEGKGYAKQSINVRRAAQECLPYLRARSEGQELRQTLLRASGASADSGATLLRPAAASSETAPHELLRPAEPEAPRKRNET